MKQLTIDPNDFNTNTTLTTESGGLVVDPRDFSGFDVNLGGTPPPDMNQPLPTMFSSRGQPAPSDAAPEPIAFPQIEEPTSFNLHPKGRIMTDEENKQYTKNAVMAVSMLVPGPQLAQGAGILTRMAGWGLSGALIGAAPAIVSGEDLGDVVEEAKTGALWGAGLAGGLGVLGKTFTALSPFARNLIQKIGDEATAGKLMTVDEAIATRGATREAVKNFHDLTLEKARLRAPMAFREWIGAQLKTMGEKAISPKESQYDIYLRWLRARQKFGGDVPTLTKIEDIARGSATQDLLKKSWMNRDFIKYLYKVKKMTRAEIRQLRDRGYFNANDLEATLAAAKLEEAYWGGKSNILGDVVWNQWVRGMAAKLRTSPRFGQWGSRLAAHIEEWNQNKDILTAAWDDYLAPIKAISRGRQEEIGAALAGKTLGKSATGLNLNAVERKALRRWYKLRSMIGKEFDNDLPIWGQDLKGRPILMGSRSNFGIPLYFDAKEVARFLADDTPQRTAFLKELMQANKFGSTSEALKWAEKAGMGSDVHWGDTVEGSLYHARSTLAKYIDPQFYLDHILHRYVRHAAGALIGQRLFGPNNLRIKGILEQVDDPKLRQEMKDMIDAMMEKPGTGTSDIKKKLTHWLALSRFGQHTGVLQLTQAFPSMATWGFLNTFKGIMAESDPAFRRLAGRVGAHLASVIDPETGGKYVTKHMGISGVRPVDRMGRTIGGVAAAFHADGLAKKAVAYARKNDYKKMREMGRQLSKLGVDLEDVLKNGGELSDGQLRRVIAEGANITNFASRRSDLPSTLYGIGRNTGRVQDKHQRLGQELVFTLASFTTQATNWFEREIYREMRHGNFMPAFRFLAIMGSPLPLALRAFYDRSRGLTEDDSDAIETIGRMDPQTLRDPEYLGELAKESAMATIEMGLVGRYGQLFGDYAPSNVPETMASLAGPGYTIPAGQLWNAGVGTQKALTEGDTELITDVLARNVPGGAYWRMAAERLKNR